MKNKGSLTKGDSDRKDILGQVHLFSKEPPNEKQHLGFSFI